MNAAVECPAKRVELAGRKQNISHMTVIAGTENAPAGQKGSIKNTLNLVISHLKNEFFTQENVLQLSQRIFDLQAQRKMEVTPELAALKAELAAKQKEMNNIIDSIKKGGYKDWMGDLGDEIDARIKYLEGKIQYSESIQERQILSQEQIYDYIMKDANLMEKSQKI